MNKIFAIIALFLSVVSAKPSVPFLAPAPVARFIPTPVVTAQSSQVQWRNYNGFAAVPAPVLPVAPAPVAVPAAVPAPLPVSNYFFRTPVSYPSYTYPFAYRSYAW